jgi:hypothetical protein
VTFHPMPAGQGFPGAPVPPPGRAPWPEGDPALSGKVNRPPAPPRARGRRVPGIAERGYPFLPSACEGASWPCVCPVKSPWPALRVRGGCRGRRARSPAAYRRARPQRPGKRGRPPPMRRGGRRKPPISSFGDTPRPRAGRHAVHIYMHAPSPAAARGPRQGTLPPPPRTHGAPQGRRSAAAPPPPPAARRAVPNPPGRRQRAPGGSGGAHNKRSRLLAEAARKSW